MAKKPTAPPSFDDRRVMSPNTFRARNRMSKSDWHRRRNRQRLGEPGSEDLLPVIIQVSDRREGIRYCDELAWQEKRIVRVAVTGKRRAQAAEAR